MLDRDELAARRFVELPCAVRPGSPVYIDPAVVEAVGPSPDDAAKSYVAVTHGEYKVAIPPAAVVALLEGRDQPRPALVPVAPASGAPLAAPSRPECRPYVYSHLKVDGAPPVAWAIRSGTGDYDTFRWTAAEAHEEVARLNSDEYGHDVQKIVKRRPFSAVPLYATSSERAAAGLPVDESATKPVDRVALAKALWRSWNGDDDVGYSGEVREGYVRAADAAIAFMAKAPAFDEASEREAALGVWRTTVGGLPDNFVEGWLARARVAAKGGA